MAVNTHPKSSSYHYCFFIQESSSVKDVFVCSFALDSVHNVEHFHMPVLRQTMCACKTVSKYKVLQSFIVRQKISTFSMLPSLTMSSSAKGPDDIIIELSISYNYYLYPESTKFCTHTIPEATVATRHLDMATLLLKWRHYNMDEQWVVLVVWWIAATCL
jgi:hypothetical protein